MRNKYLRALAVASLLCWAVPASAEFNCSMVSWTTNRGQLFSDSGTRSTKGPTIVVIPECQHGASGIYGNVAGFMPFTSAEGREIDFRIGWRGQILGLDLDLSTADYIVWPAAGKTLNIFHLAGSVSKRFEINPATGFAPYWKFDWGHGIQVVRGDSVALGIGGTLDWKMSVWGEPKLVVDGAIWFRPVQTQSPGRGPVKVLDLGLNYALTGPMSLKGTIGPYVLLTHGSVNEPRKKGVETMWGLRAIFSF